MIAITTSSSTSVNAEYLHLLTTVSLSNGNSTSVKPRSIACEGPQAGGDSFSEQQICLGRFVGRCVCKWFIP